MTKTGRFYNFTIMTSKLQKYNKILTRVICYGVGVIAAAICLVILFATVIVASMALYMSISVVSGFVSIITTGAP